MSETSFDPDLFLQQETDSALETKYTPIPGGEYVAMLDDNLGIREYDNTPIVEVTYVIDNPELSEQMGMERLTINQGLFIEQNPDGSIAFGPNKNVKLGRLRSALGQNEAGQTWNFQMLRGAGPVMIKVEPKPGTEYSQVVGVTAMPG